jgi:hypothetical protein
MSIAEHEPGGSHVHCFVAKQKNLQTNHVGTSRLLLPQFLSSSLDPFLL